MENMGNLLNTTQSTPAATDTPASANYQTSTGVNRATTPPVASSVPMKGSMSKNVTTLFVVLCLIVITGGVATGAGISKLQAKNANGPSTFQGQKIQAVAGNDIKNGQVFGSANEKDFKDFAEGYLEIGGMDGEGSHHLLREGGISQTVYLTSSVTDLDKFQGMTVKVWGETFKGQKASWLMDVGRVQVVETKAQPPVEAAQAPKGKTTTKTQVDQE